jgi:nucleotide-binding universal stress UspA family protein
MSELFPSVVCGVDASEAGKIAARVAARVADPDGALVLVAVDDPSLAVHGGWQAVAIAAQLLHDAQAALAQAHDEATSTHPVETRLLEGDPLRCLLAEAERRDASLVAAGTHGQSRPVGIALGSVSTSLLHEAPCSVLIARAPRAEPWPRSLVVGIDGSPGSAEALAAARALSARFGVPLRAVVATGEGTVDLEAARRLAPELEELPGSPVDELHALSEDADLVVVGSRGLKGLRALGSVSERIAHEARCSVLVVRGSRTGTQEEAR